MSDQRATYWDVRTISSYGPPLTHFYSPFLCNSEGYHFELMGPAMHTTSEAEAGVEGEKRAAVLGLPRLPPELHPDEVCARRKKRWLDDIDEVMSMFMACSRENLILPPYDHNMRPQSQEQIQSKARLIFAAARTAVLPNQEKAGFEVPLVGFCPTHGVIDTVNGRCARCDIQQAMRSALQQNLFGPFRRCSKLSGCIFDEGHGGVLRPTRPTTGGETMIEHRCRHDYQFPECSECHAINQLDGQFVNRGFINANVTPEQLEYLRTHDGARYGAVRFGQQQMQRDNEAALLEAYMDGFADGVAQANRKRHAALVKTAATDPEHQYVLGFKAGVEAYTSALEGWKP